MHLSKSDIINRLKYKDITIEVYETVTSTNTLLKQRGHRQAPHGLVIAAETQTAGRGRMSRDFYSPDRTGVYFSILLRPSLSPADSLLITTAAAVACARVLEQISGKKAGIKWVNDIYIDGKKVCGILTEASLANGRIDFAVLGIGINLYMPKNGFPEELKSKAGSVFETESSDLRAKLIAEILNNFLSLYETIEKREFIEEYRQRSILDNLPIHVIKQDSVTPATALYIDEELRLVVRYLDGKIEALSSGDVSIAKP